MTNLSKLKCNSQNRDPMPLFMVKKKYFDFYRSGAKDVELRAIRPQWKNSKSGDVPTIMCWRDIVRKRIVKIHRGTLARIFKNVDYKRVFPESSTVFEAVEEMRKLYPDEEEFMAFELEGVV